MGTFLSYPKAYTINVFVQPRQKNNRQNQELTIIRSKDIEQTFTAIEQRMKPSNTINID